MLVNLLDTNETATVADGPLDAARSRCRARGEDLHRAIPSGKPLDPVVISNSPAHDATSVPTWSPIVLQFSAPMDTNSVQTNFATIPAVSGTFAWSPAARHPDLHRPAEQDFPA